MKICRAVISQRSLHTSQNRRSCSIVVSSLMTTTPSLMGVVVIKEDTTIEQLRRFCEVCKERWGITALQIFIHRDEGHYGIPGDNATWKPDLHAHIVWDWMNHEMGKSCKLDEKAMNLKPKTGKYHD